MISLENIIKQILKEENVSGGQSSSFGPGVVNTEGPFSGDKYAAGDARIPHSLFGGKMFRRINKNKRFKKSNKRQKK